MHALTVVAAFLGGGAAVTFIGAKLIERAHPPCGRFLEIGGLCQHVVELGEGAGVVNGPAIVLLHGAGCNLEDMRLALAERLAARHRVILLDRPGLGWSERKGSNGSPAYQAVERGTRSARSGPCHSGRPFLGRLTCADLCARLSAPGCRARRHRAADPSLARANDVALFRFLPSGLCCSDQAFAARSCRKGRRPAT
jgi:pimeloyl-ACP methyl ester carboxylesterase